MDIIRIPDTDLTLPPFAAGAMWWGTRAAAVAPLVRSSAVRRRVRGWGGG